MSALPIPLAPASASAAEWSPVHAGDFPDPDVLVYDGVYYGFSTQNFASLGRTINIQESTSTNGVTWTASTTDALPTLPSWAEAGNTWAPSVAYNGSEFVMYYVATQTSTGDQCIGQAESSSPEGPYVDTMSTPFICQDTDIGGVNDNFGGSIDPDIFVDTNGDAYLIWKSDGNHVGVPTYIWSQPLTSNLLTLTGSPVVILSDDEAWQGAIVEGPDMVDNGGTYYLFYSGGAEGSSTYAVGWALCPQGPSEPCMDGGTGATADNPILTSEPGMSGPGGPDVFESPSGQLEMAFAAWQGTTIGYLDCGIRPMYLASLTFTDDIPVLAPAVSGSGAAGNPSCAPLPQPPGYWQVASDGGIFTFGAAQFYGSTGSLRLNKPVVGMAATPDGRGYWLVASDGGIFAFGDAQFWGSTGAIKLNKPIVGMVPTIDGRGYWLVASDGGIFAFGDAHYYGSLGGSSLYFPITAMAPGFLNGGYWLVDSNGDVFSYGDAHFEGQPDSAPGGYRITGMASTRDANGYWLASANGNVASEGDAPPYGDLIGHTLNAPIVGMAQTSDGFGYWLQGADGGIFCFGDAQFLGSMGGHHLNAPMVGIAGI
ncbi:MAG TPA: glycoside hydrolase family 43 protein [Acidimicrobiales bacterium]